MARSTRLGATRARPPRGQFGGLRPTVATRLSDNALENVIVGLGIARRVGRPNCEGGAKLPQEHAIVGAYLPAFTTLPAGNERLGRRQDARSGLGLCQLICPILTTLRLAAARAQSVLACVVRKFDRGLFFYPAFGLSASSTPTAKARHPLWSARRPDRHARSGF
jgi:hypothetical protein